MKPLRAFAIESLSHRRTKLRRQDGEGYAKAARQA
jgi:hypothetical protein